jgi:predicted dinucleotide-binding enzyme
LAKRLIAAGHQVWITNSRGPDSLAELARATGVIPVPITELAKDKEVVIFAITLKNVPGLPKDFIDELSNDIVVVDACNYFPKRDGRIDLIESGTPHSRWMERQIGRPVIKAFNSIAADHLDSQAKPPGAGDRVALPVSGDNPVHKAKVMELVDAIGFDPVDAGGIDESWRQQPGTPCFVADLDKESLRRALAEANPPAYGAAGRV